MMDGLSEKAFVLFLRFSCGSGRGHHSSYDSYLLVPQNATPVLWCSWLAAAMLLHSQAVQVAAAYVAGLLTMSLWFETLCFCTLSLSR